MLLVLLLPELRVVAQSTTILNFNGTNGNTPYYGALVNDGTYLYGTTSLGGTNGAGNVFKIKPDGSGYVDLLDFTGTTSNGGHPYGSLFYDGTFLYGMTQNGGVGFYGTIFKIKPDGTGYLKLYDFSGSDGQYPYGSLVSDGTYLYGMTSQGGANNLGEVFKIKFDGTGFAKLVDFSGSNGKVPYGSLYYDGVYLYGMTAQGGAISSGIIFKMKTDGTGFADIFDFGVTNGSYPTGDLVSDGTYLYGMTNQGGAHSMGVAFRIKPDGTSFLKLFDFAGPSNGSYPYGSFLFNGGLLFGLTSQGGTSGYGLAFKILPDGTGYTKLLDFSGSANGSNPYGSMITDGT
ncbi:MAG TPA: choice-of-anchor tandem repeat GloVer-containing protein, partial [Bacteroidia bacterium]